MSEQLNDMVRKYIVKNGTGAVEALAYKARVAPNVIRNVLYKGHVPRSYNIYKLAIACGASKEDALKLGEVRAAEGPRKRPDKVCVPRV